MSLYYDQTLNDLKDLVYRNTTTTASTIYNEYYTANLTHLPFHYSETTALNTLILESVFTGLYLFTLLFTLYIIFAYHITHFCCLCTNDCTRVAFGDEDERNEFELAKSQNVNYMESCSSFFNRSHFWTYVTLYSVSLQCALRVLQSGFSLAASFYVRYALIRTLDTIFQVTAIPFNTWIIFCFMMLCISVCSRAVSDKRHRLIVRIFIALFMSVLLLLVFGAIAVSVLFEAGIDARTSPISVFNPYWSRIVTIFIAIPVFLGIQFLLALFSICYTVLVFARARMEKGRDRTWNKHHPAYDPVMNAYRRRSNIVLLALLFLQVLFIVGIGSRLLGMLFLMLRAIGTGLPLLLFVIFTKVSELFPVWFMCLLLYPMPIRGCARPIGFNMLTMEYARPKSQDFRRSVRQSVRMSNRVSTRMSKRFSVAQFASPRSTTKTNHSSTMSTDHGVTPRPKSVRSTSPYIDEDMIDELGEMGSDWRMSARNHSRVLELENELEAYEYEGN